MKLLLAVAILVLVPVQWGNVCVSRSDSESVQCREDERSALLHINASMSFPIYSLDDKWEGKECCRWKSVTCDPSTGHVTQLDLPVDGWFNYEQGILLNASMFLPLRQLRSLSLSGLGIYNCTDSAGFESWSNLTKLEMLDLSENQLDRSIISSLAKVSSLRALYLDDNFMGGSINVPVKELSALNLEVLSLSGCMFEGSFPYLGHWSTSLKALSLSANDLNDTLTSEGICQLKNLEELDLYDNNFTGNLPLSFVPQFTIANTLLRLSYFHWYDGERSTDFGVELMSKGRLDYYLEGILKMQYIIDLSSNRLVGNIPEDIGRMNWLITLNLSNNHLRGAIPNSISNLRQLESLDLSHNSLTGEIPKELTKLTSLESFSVAYNNLSGPTLVVEAQFISFDNSSYEGNPNLCGLPLSKSCVPTHGTT